MENIIEIKTNEIRRLHKVCRAKDKAIESAIKRLTELVTNKKLSKLDICNVVHCLEESLG